MRFVERAGLAPGDGGGQLGAGRRQEGLEPELTSPQRARVEPPDRSPHTERGSSLSWLV